MLLQITLDVTCRDLVRLNNAKSLKPLDQDAFCHLREYRTAKMQMAAHSAVFNNVKCAADSRTDLLGVFRICEKMLSTEVRRTSANWPLLASACHHSHPAEFSLCFSNITMSHLPTKLSVCMQKQYEDIITAIKLEVLTGETSIKLKD